MQQARILEPVPSADESPLARARVHRQLTLDEAARRAGVAPEELHWLEEGRLYRFPTTDRAVLVTLLYATALELDHREALGLAGMQVPPISPEASPLKRFGAITAFAALILAAVLAIAFARNESAAKPQASVAASSASGLPAPWAIKVVVLNGSGDIVFTRTVASRIQALSYRIEKVGRAASFSYPQTQVYYPPGGEAIAERLAKQLDVPIQPLPGGNDPKRLVVIVGPEKAVGN
jgi:hypothetical protein